MSTLEQFSSLCDKLRDEGHQVVACVARYDASGAYFSTRLSLSGTEAEQDHYLLDAVREISVEWSNSRHDAKLAWKDA